MQYRAKVRKVSSSGVTVEVPDLCPGETFGPLERIGLAPSVGDWVLVADVGEDCSPDLIVVGKATTAADPAASVMVHDHSTSLLGGAIPQASVTGLVGAGTWTPYDPEWTSSGTQPSKGNGTLTGHYAQLGDTITVEIVLTWGSTTNGGTGTHYLSLPFAQAIGAPLPAMILDTGYAWLGGWTWVPAASTTAGAIQSGITQVSATSPMTWTTGDKLIVGGTYRKA